MRNEDLEINSILPIATIAGEVVIRRKGAIYRTNDDDILSMTYIRWSQGRPNGLTLHLTIGCNTRA